jgi:copper chaperone CopZ
VFIVLLELFLVRQFKKIKVVEIQIAVNPKKKINKMKNLIYSVLIVNILFTISCTSDKKQNKVIIVKESNIVKKSITVKGMTCVGCEITLEESVSKIEGVVNVKASHKKEKAFIEFDSTKTNIKTIKQSIKKTGYKTY